MAAIKTIQVPVKVIDRIKKIALQLRVIADEFSEFETIYDQMDDVLKDSTKRAPARSSWKRWTASEIRLATRLKSQGKSYREVAMALAENDFPFRSVEAVKHYFRYLRH